MKNDQVKNIVLQVFLLLFLFFTLFESNMVSKWALAIFLSIYAFIVHKLIKKREIISIYDKQVCIITTILAIIYLAGFYLLGIYFGFYESSVKLSLWSLWAFTIPTAIIIVSSEITRYVFISQKSKISRVLTFISMVIIDLLVYVNLYNINNLKELLRVIGYIFFASVSCNLLYNYTSKRFGYKPIIIYRLITSLYTYIIPIIPNLFIFFRSTLRIVYPYIIYLILESTYAKTNRFSEYKDRNKKIINTTITTVIAILITMLVSCKFMYGILVIGSGSMTGEIDKGDAVIYKEIKKDKEVKKGQVIVFQKDESRIIHRVIKKINVNGKNHYITKGDANQEADEGYIEDENIIGIVKLKIKYIGYPTLWVNEIFDGK